jgi:hypothetical protein
MAFSLCEESSATCNQGLVALAPHIETLKLAIPSVVGHLPDLLHILASDLPIITGLKIKWVSAVQLHSTTFC